MPLVTGWQRLAAFIKRAGGNLPRVFMAHGMLLGTLSAQIPLLRDRLSLSPQALGLALFCASAGALIGMPLTGWAMRRIGAVLLIRGGAVLGGVSLLAALDAPGPLTLGGALFAFGLGFGTVDVAMNALAVAREQEGGRAILGGIHAMWSVGSFAGSLGGAALLSVVPAVEESAIVIGLSTSLLLHATRGVAAPAREVAKAGHGEVLPIGDARLWLFGCLMSLSFAIEGGVADWSGLFLHLERGASPATAPLAYSAFALAMVAMRFGGDAVRARLGDVRILLGGFLVACGLLGGVVAPGPLVALAGFACAGAGVANVVPALFALAGTRGGGAGAISLVSTMGYAGVLLAPPLTGFVASVTSIGVALGSLGLCGGVIGAGGLWLARRKSVRSEARRSLT